MSAQLDVDKFFRELPRRSPADQAHLIAEAMRVVYGLEIDETRLLLPVAMIDRLVREAEACANGEVER